MDWIRWTLSALVLLTPALLRAEDQIAEFVSVPREDGSIRESWPGSGVGQRVELGGTSPTALRAGSDFYGRRYRFLVSFDTSALPDDAVITSAELELTRGDSTTSYFHSNRPAKVEVQPGAFSNSDTLEPRDFAANAQPADAVLEDQGGRGSRYHVDVPADQVSVVGTTQVRVSSGGALDRSSYGRSLGFYPGDSSWESRRPRLFVTFTSAKQIDVAATPGFSATPSPSTLRPIPPASVATPATIVQRPAVAGAVPPAVTVATTTSGIWSPRPGTSWQWQLTGAIDTSLAVDMYDIDLFDAPEATIAALKRRGTKVVCYFSAGTSEDWRSDFSKIPSSTQGRSNGWAGEKWLDIRQIDALAPAMRGRLDLAAQKGCDAVEPDNVDGYSNDTGFAIASSDQIAYNRWLAREAHARGLSVGLKNDVDQVTQLVDDFDWALNEQCFEYDECGAYSAFVNRGKAVFGVEYGGSIANICSKARALGGDWLIKRLDLDAYRVACS